MYTVWHIDKKSLQNKQKFSSTQTESTCGLLGYPYGYIIYIYMYTQAVLPTVRLLLCQFLNFFVKILFDQQGQGVYLTLKNLLKQSTISNQMLG